LIIQSAKAQTQAVPYVEVNLCQCCPKCAARAVCRSNALIQLDPGEPPFVDSSRCYGCNLCLTACPFEAIRRTPLHTHGQAYG
jgi:MinD superfamily P-loop ATPase